MLGDGSLPLQGRRKEGEGQEREGVEAEVEEEGHFMISSDR